MKIALSCSLEWHFCRRNWPSKDQVAHKPREPSPFTSEIRILDGGFPYSPIERSQILPQYPQTIQAYHPTSLAALVMAMTFSGLALGGSWQPGEKIYPPGSFFPSSIFFLVAL